MHKENSLTKKLTTTNAILIYLSLFKLILLLIFAGNYGIFRDEYYYIETSKHLAFGYVDLQPLSAILLAVSRFIFGDSIFGIRIFSYLAGSAIVFVTGLIARELGGTKFAQISSAFLVIFCGVVLGASSYFSMNSFDILLSTLMIYYLIKLINTGNPKLWIVIGLLFRNWTREQTFFFVFRIWTCSRITFNKIPEASKSKRTLDWCSFSSNNFSSKCYMADCKSLSYA